MSLESAKKYGYISSIINVILPIVSIFILIGTLYLIFSSIVANSTEFMAGPGLIAGLLIAVAATGVIALILFFLSMYRLSNYYKEPAIFRNVLYGFLLTIIGGIISAVIILGFTSTITTELLDTTTTGNFMAVVSQFIIVYAATLIVSMIFTIINGVFYWKAFTVLGEKSGVGNFKTTGLLYLIGSVTSIIGVGSIVIWIAWIFATQSYKQLQPQPNPVFSYNTDTATQQPYFGKIYCSACGTENISNTCYCKHCGKLLQTTPTNS